MDKIIKNMAKCQRCGDIIESKHTHDFKTCRCGTISVDGGYDYIKRTYAYDPTDIIELSVIEEE